MAVKVFDSGTIPGLAQMLNSLLSRHYCILIVVHFDGAVDDKELTVSANQGNGSLFVHSPYLVIMGEQCWTVNALPMLDKKYKGKLRQPSLNFPGTKYCVRPSLEPLSHALPS